MKKRILIFSLLLTLVGCKINEHNFEFAKDEISVNEQMYSCDLIKSVDGKEIDKSMYGENELILEKGPLTCEYLNTSKLGMIEVTFKYDKQVFKHLVNVVDDKAPTIVVDETYTVEVGNEYFDPLNKIIISDNYDSDLLKEIKGDYDLNKAGIYDVSVYAKDSSGNEANAKFKIEVVDKEKEVIEVPVYIPSEPDKNNSTTITPDSNNTNDNSNTDSNNNHSGSVNDYQSGNGDVEFGGWIEGPEIDVSGSGSGGGFISGTRDITVAVGSSLNDLIYELSSGISTSSAITIDYSNVNLSVPGSYSVFYYGEDGATASCVVTVS